MSNKFLKATMLGLCMLFCMTETALGNDQFDTAPRLNNGHKWRIGYYEGGPDANYYNYLISTIRGLMELGWIEKATIPEGAGMTCRDLWGWLVHHMKSSNIEFVQDAFYSALWDKDQRIIQKAAILERLNKKKDIDLMFAMGSWSGKDLASNEHSTPTIIMSVSDPIQAGIISSVEDSGFDHVHCRVDPQRYERQIRTFHDVVKFKKLGIAFEPSPLGRTYAAVDTAQKLGDELGFEVVSCSTQSDIADQHVADESVVKCFKEISEKADAIYVTYQQGVNSKTIPELVKIANEHKIPTFSQAGAEWVKSGFLMSNSRAGFKPVGMFEAATIAKIFNGAKPRQLPQLYRETHNIALNLRTASIIEIYLYADVLAAADEIYNEEY